MTTILTASSLLLPNTASSLLLPHLDLCGNVVLLLLGIVNRQVRASHRRQAGDALVRASDFRVVGVAELHLRPLWGADGDRLGVRIHSHELPLSDARLLGQRGHHSDHQHNCWQNEKRASGCSHVYPPSSKGYPTTVPACVVSSLSTRPDRDLAFKPQIHDVNIE